MKTSTCLLSFAGFLGALAIASAEENVVPVAARSHEDVRPSPQAEAVFAINGMRLGRMIELSSMSIHRQAMIVGADGSIYFLTPPGCLVTNTEAQLGDPSYLFEVERNHPDGYVHASATVRVMTDETRRASLETLLDPDNGDVPYIIENAVAQYVGGDPEKAGGKAEVRRNLAAILNDKNRPVEEKLAVLREHNLNLSLRPWPLIHAVMVCKDFQTNEIYCVAESDSIRGTKEEFHLALKFEPEAFERMCAAERKSNVQFVYYYSYSGRKTYNGEIETRGGADLFVGVSEVITSAQAAGQVPLFGGEKRKVQNYILVSLRTILMADNPEIIPLLREGSIAAQIFAADTLMTIDDIEADPATRAAFLQYVKPHLETFREHCREANIDVKIHEDEHGTGEEDRSSWSVFGFVGGSETDTKFRRALDRFEKESGVTMGWDKETQSFVPHSVNVCRMQEGWQNKVLDESTAVYLSVRKSDDYLESPPIFSVFRYETVQVKAETSARISKLRGEREENRRKFDRNAAEIAALQAELEEILQASNSRSAELLLDLNRVAPSIRKISQSGAEHILLTELSKHVPFGIFAILSADPRDRLPMKVLDDEKRRETVSTEFLEDGEKQAEMFEAVIRSGWDPIDADLERVSVLVGTIRKKIDESRGYVEAIEKLDGNLDAATGN